MDTLAESMLQGELQSCNQADPICHGYRNDRENKLITDSIKHYGYWKTIHITHVNLCPYFAEWTSMIKDQLGGKSCARATHKHFTIKLYTKRGDEGREHPDPEASNSSVSIGFTNHDHKNPQSSRCADRRDGVRKASRTAPDSRGFDVGQIAKCLFF